MLKFYNTLTRKKEIFKPIIKNEVSIYTCGPTPYDYAHIGNFRTYIFQDLLRRYLKYNGFKITQVMNITDVDDKTIKGSRNEGVPLREYTDKYKKAFFEDIKALNIEKAELYPEATKHIKEMIELIKGLLKAGIAYKGKDGSIYFSIAKFKGYGKLSHINLKGLKAGARVSQDEYTKENVADFVLWKAWDEGEGKVYWQTELGKGRPGWHIECSAMSMKYLEQIDIHSGGVDLIFPHHENEIAQSEGVTGKAFARYWLHAEHLIVEGKKMSKSLGNFYTLRDLLNKGYNPKAIRYLLLSAHYRQKLDFTLSGLEAAKNSIEKIKEFFGNLEQVKSEAYNQEIPGIIGKVKKDFTEALDDDLNISLAMAHLFDFIKEINKKIMENKIGRKNADEIYRFVFDIDKILGLNLQEDIIKWYSLKDAKGEVKKLIERRELFRKRKDWKKADNIRAKLRGLGIILEDTELGPRWRKVK